MNVRQFEEYKNDLYDLRIEGMKNRIDSIMNLNIKYPCNANPIFYLYIVPDDNFRELLDFPDYIKSEWGGKPVKSYDLDGFNSAYGQSSNILRWTHPISLSEDANSTHELAHLVQSMFFTNKSFLGEGVADALTFYILEFEDKLDDYKNLLKTLTEDDILSANELIIACNENKFNSIPLIPNKFCSFSKYYISSYLFVRGCIEAIEKSNNIDKVEATQIFLSIIWKSEHTNQYLIFDIAKNINIDKEELLNSKSIQMNILNKIKNPTD